MSLDNSDTPYTTYIDTDARAYTFGYTLGSFFKDCPNIILFNGQDNWPGDNGTTESRYNHLGNGLEDGYETGPYEAFISHHPGAWRDTFSSYEWFHNQSWLDFNLNP